MGSQAFVLRSRANLGVLAAFSLVACANGERPSKRSVGSNTDRISIDGSSVTVGFESGKLRQNVTVRAFDITRTPVTATQYALCAKARVCRPSPAAEKADTPAVEEPGAAPPDGETIAEGISTSDARDYCAWVGGKLPSLSQWLLAARGPSPQRFAWGNRLPTCDEHPGGVNRGIDDTVAARVRQAASYSPCGSSATSRYRVAEHAAGASPSGLQDVLLAATEIVAKDEGSLFGVCRGQQGTCGVYGSMAGAMDFVRSMDPEPGEALTDQGTRPSGTGPAFAFRCVWGEGDEG